MGRRQRQWLRGCFALALWALIPPPAAAGSAESKAARRAEAKELASQIAAGSPPHPAVNRIRFLSQEQAASEELAGLLRDSLDPRRRRNLAEALALLASPAAEPALLALLRDPDGAVRMQALKGLGRIKSRAVERMLPLLSDSSLGVRREAALALGAAEDPRVGKRLLLAASSEGEPEVREAMLLAVGQSRDRDQEKPLEKFLHSSSESTRLAAARALCLLEAAGGGGAGCGWRKLEEAAREAELSRIRALPLGERLLAVSEGFLGAPYLNSPLGEGEGKDPDPLFRLDAVDCLTFVEETIALSLAPSEKQVVETLNLIRYSREPSYEGRNHLMEAEWLPNNVKKGFLRELTRRLGGEEVEMAVKQLTPRTWTSPSSSALSLSPPRQITGRFPLAIIPLDQVLERAKRAPSGTVLVVVREERALLPTRVSHLGFLVQKKRPFLRHASRSFGRVVDEDLESFLLRNSRYHKWKVVGAALYEVVSPPS